MAVALHGGDRLHDDGPGRLLRAQGQADRRRDARLGLLPKARDVVEVKLVKRPRTESAVGTIRAIHEVAVASKILARVKEVKVKAGQTVKAGDELVLLDDADLQARLHQAQAAESGANAKLNQARTDVERAKRLRAVNSVSQQEFEQAETAYLSAKAELERAQQAVKEAQILQGYALIRAPIGGVIVDKKVNAGDTVSPGPGPADNVRSPAACRWSPRCGSLWRWSSRSVSRWPRGSIRWGWIATPRSPRSCPRPRPRAGHSR